MLPNLSLLRRAHAPLLTALLAAPPPFRCRQVDSTAGITVGQWLRVYSTPPEAGGQELQVSGKVAALGDAWLELDRQLPFAGESHWIKGDPSQPVQAVLMRCCCCRCFAAPLLCCCCCFAVLLLLLCCSAAPVCGA